MATEYGDTHGSQPWHDAQPPYGQSPYGQSPYGQPGHSDFLYGGLPGSGPSFPGPPRREPPPDLGALGRRHRARQIAWALLAVGGIGVAVALTGIVSQSGPRSFTAAQQRQITDWEYGKRWRELPAGTIFPASVSYPAPKALDDPSLTLAARRVGIAKQASCAAAADPAAAAVLVRDGCSAVLRATYVDETDSFVVTVGAAVLPGSAKAKTAAQAIAHADGSGGLGPTVRALPFKGTPAGEFTDQQRQLSGVVSRGTYVVLYTVGFADSRHQQKISEDSYTDGEMTSVGTGVADDVLSKLAAPVPSPHCPGVGIPGC